MEFFFFGPNQLSDADVSFNNGGNCLKYHGTRYPYVGDYNTYHCYQNTTSDKMRRYRGHWYFRRFIDAMQCEYILYVLCHSGCKTFFCPYKK